MAKYFLLNPVLVAAGRLLWPGTLVDDAQENLAAIGAKGGRLYPSSNATVAAGAAEAERVKRAGGTVEQAAAVMSQAAATADAASSGGGGASDFVHEYIPLNYGYTSGQSVAVGGGAFGTSPVDVDVQVEDPFFLFQPMVPMLVLGANASVIDASPDPLGGNGNGVNLGVTATFTLTGTDVTGAALSASLTVSKQGAFSFKRGFRTLLHLSSDVAPGVIAQIYTGKGFVTSNPFVPDTMRFSVLHPILSTASFVHGPSGAVVPDDVWNVGEGTVHVVYRVARGGT